MMDAESPSQKQSLRTDVWLLLALFVSFRFLTLFLLKPGGFIRDWSDFDTYLGIAQLSDYGLYPFLHFWLEWPPLMPWVMVGAYRLSLLIPVWGEDPRLWFVLIFGAVLVLFEAGNFWLLYRLARRLFAERAQILLVLAMYALLFPPVYAMLGFFDGVALFFILLSLDLLLADRPKTAAIATAAGAVVKLTPIIAAGVAGWLLWHRLKPDWRRVLTAWLGYGLTMLGAIVVFLLPFLLTAPQWLAAHLRAVLGRSSWETVWAVLEGYFRFGQLVGNRLNPAETAFAVHPSTLPWLWISLAFAALYLLVFFLPVKKITPRRLLAFGGVTITLFLLYSKGYSPQFLVYVLPFIILLMPNWVGVGYALALTALNVLEQPIYFVVLPDSHWLLIAIVWARFTLFAALAVEFWFQVSGFGLRALNAMRAVVLVGVFIGMASLLPRAVGEYWATQMLKNPQHTVIAFLQTQKDTVLAPVIVDDQQLYQQIYPPLHHDFRLKLAGGDAKFAGAPSPATLVAGEGSAWWLTTSGAVPPLGTPLDSYRFENGETLMLVDFSGDGVVPQPTATAENGVQLISARVTKADDAVVLTLFWRATDPLSTDYTVFTQLLSIDGQFIAGHDSPPANGARPTSGWQPDDLVADVHAVPLPANLPPGEYRLVVGMYDAVGQRLPFFGADSSPLAGDAVLVQLIELP